MTDDAPQNPLERMREHNDAGERIVDEMTELLARIQAYSDEQAALGWPLGPDLTNYPEWQRRKAEEVALLGRQLRHAAKGELLLADLDVQIKADIERIERLDRLEDELGGEE